MTGLDLDEWGRDRKLAKAARAKVSKPAPADTALLQQQIAALSDRLTGMGKLFADDLAKAYRALDASRRQTATLQGRLQRLEERAVSQRPVASVALAGAVYNWISRLAFAVADEWDVAAPDLLGSYKGGAVIRPRFALTWLVRETGDYSLPLVGRLMNRDHQSIRYALKRATELRERDDAFRHVTDQLLIIARRLRAEGQANATAPGGAA